jgi:hypothetical protein
VNAERDYAEEVSTIFARMGMAPAVGKLLGWLLICDPPGQTVTQMSEALGLSKGSVSTGMRMLQHIGFVRRVPAKGREHAYEMLPDALVRAADARANYLIAQQAMQKGLDLLGDEDSPRAQRLRIGRDFYAFVADRVPGLMEEFTKTHLRKG